MPSETWKPVGGYEGFYEISDLGRVRSLTRSHTFKNRWGKVVPRTIWAKVMTPDVSFGYLRVNLRDGTGKGQHARVHVLVLSAFIGPAPSGMQGRHLDGDRANCALSNLCWGTKKENENDKLIHGTLLSGADHPSAKLTADDVEKIRAEYKPRVISCRMLGEIYGVSGACIYDIVSRRSWNSPKEVQHAV